MKLSYALALPASLCLALSGCQKGGPNLPQGLIHTNLVSNNVYSNWPNAVVLGNAVQSSCFPSDPNCIINEEQPADGSGNVSFASDAIPGLWNIGAEADSYCSAGAGTSTQQLDATHVTQLYCGTVNQATAYISPNACEHDTYLDGTVFDNCPATLTATVPKQFSFPTNHAMNVSKYTVSGSSLGSQGITASSATTLNIPTPTPAGENVIIIRDPNTNQILLSGLFTKTIYREKCTPKTC